jgi:hypothetical protein
MAAAVATTPSMDGWRQQSAALKSKCKTRNDSSSRSQRSLVSEDEQSTTLWGRTFNPLRAVNRSTNLSNPPAQHHSSESGSRNQHENKTLDHVTDSLFVAELSTLTVSCDSWYGTVAIGQDVSERHVSLSPERRSKEKLRHLEVPMTPPRSKKKKSKKGLSPKTRKGKLTGSLGVDVTPPNSPVLWGDYGLAQNPPDLQTRLDSFYDPGSPGRTPGKRLKERLRLSHALFDHIEDSASSLKGKWSELLGSTCVEDSPQAQSVSSLILEVTSDNSGGQMPEAPPLVTHNDNSFLGRFHAAFPKRRETDDGSEQELDTSSRILFDDQASNQSGISDDADMGKEVEEKISKSRLIRFADEQGLPIARIHVVGDEHDPYATSRIIVLFLDPVAKKFEFMQGAFSLKAGATVSDLLRQLPDFVVEETFAEMEYVSMYGTSDGPRQFGLNDRLHELNLCKREIVVAVMKGASGEHLVNEAAPLLTNTKITRAVSMNTERLVVLQTPFRFCSTIGVSFVIGEKG